MAESTHVATGEWAGCGRRRLAHCNRTIGRQFRVRARPKLHTEGHKLNTYGSNSGAGETTTAPTAFLSGETSPTRWSLAWGRWQEGGSERVKVRVRVRVTAKSSSIKLRIWKLLGFRDQNQRPTSFSVSNWDQNFGLVSDSGFLLIPLCLVANLVSIRDRI